MHDLMMKTVGAISGPINVADAYSTIASGSKCLLNSPAHKKKKI
jgi:hypothetical protein